MTIVGSSPSRRHRGAQTEHIVARFWQAHGFPFATVRRGAGTDLVNTGRICVEIKARTGFAPLAWIKQARGNTPQGHLAVVIIRCNGMGIESLADWPVMMRHADLLLLLAAAGLTTEADT